MYFRIVFVNKINVSVTSLFWRISNKIKRDTTCMVSQESIWNMLRDHLEYLRNEFPPIGDTIRPSCRPATLTNRQYSIFTQTVLFNPFFQKVLKIKKEILKWWNVFLHNRTIPGLIQSVLSMNKTVTGWVLAWPLTLRFDLVNWRWPVY